ncbi:3-phosphoshikimate 1-carboxyvinyltransferase, chloroplastic [Nicotiana attenuata]|uniref:3-phosphoshikimate 1-carboxyvinyltransferase, chloroplastic n=1 Tax=Nicotiana attenuata TaxID=49451 RepID=A0A314L570_NICAT|nr:3-phosphoshikimate 1-carboxyvinyltransferase, chloroplastic [Nicotiana attenuata]
MVEETVFEDFAKTIQSDGVRMGANFDKLGKRLDGLNQKLDNILEMLGISVEDKGTDYHVLKEDQESATKEIEVGESSDQEVPSGVGILRSVDAPNKPMVEPMKLEDAYAGKCLSLKKIEARNKIFIPPLEIVRKLEPTKYAEIEVSQQVPLSLDLESLLCERHMVGQCAKNFMCIITGVRFGRSEESHDSLKLFDELLELDVAPISCLFADSSYVSEDQNDETIILFDPGVAKGLTVRDLTALNYYGSLGKATLDGRITAYENLLSTDDVHYIPGSLKTLGLHKKFESANQLAIVEGCEEMFPAGEEFKGGLVNAKTALCPLTITIMVAVGSSTTGFLACLIITSGTISIEGCGTSSLRGYANVILVLDLERRSYYGRKYMLGVNLAAAIDYLCHGLTPVVHYDFRPCNNDVQGTLNESKVLTKSLEFMITKNLCQHGSTMTLRTRSISSGKDCYDRELVIKRGHVLGLFSCESITFNSYFTDVGTYQYIEASKR